MKKGWKTKKLGEVCEFEGGSQPPKSQFIYEPRPGYVRFLQIRDFGSDKNITFIPESKKNRLCVEDDTLIGRYGASVGKILTGKAGAYNVALMKTVPNLGILQREWFHSYLLSDGFQERLMNVASRSAQDGFSKEDISNFPIPLPEQQRIVGILDEAFGGLATAQAHAAQNLQNARDLFESHLNAVFTQRGDGWVEKTLGDVAQLKNGLNYNRDSKGQTLPVVGVGDFQSNNLVPVDQLQTVTIDGELSTDYSLQYGDVLTVRSNGSKDLVGRCMLVPKLSQTTSYSGFIIRIRVNMSEISPPFLLYFMKSSDTRDRLTRDGGGANISNINQTKLAALPLSLPPIAEQNKLVNQLDALSSETQRLTRIYEQKLAALSELKKSLLHQAFSGEL
jgi:type I restriction enzyme S subunit